MTPSMVSGHFIGKKFNIVSIETRSKEPWHYENNSIANLVLQVENMELLEMAHLIPSEQKTVYGSEEEEILSD